ncbi:hypothetical protein JW872_02265 [Candidatus Babeliales bacterium]|nr:hypothetical protein [Candidatus Babeliales bacterium]
MIHRTVKIFFMFLFLVAECCAQEGGPALDVQIDMEALNNAVANIPATIEQAQQLTNQDLPAFFKEQRDQRNAQIMWQNTLRGQMKLPLGLPAVGVYNKDLVYMTEFTGLLAADVMLLKTIQSQQVEHVYQVCTKHTTEMMDLLKHIASDMLFIAKDPYSLACSSFLASEFTRFFNLLEMPLHNVRTPKTMFALAGVISANEYLPAWRRSSLANEPLNPRSWCIYKKNAEGQLEVSQEQRPLGLGTTTQWLTSFIKHPILNFILMLPTHRLAWLTTDRNIQNILTLPSVIQRLRMLGSRVGEMNVINDTIEEQREKILPTLLSFLIPPRLSWLYSKPAILCAKYLSLMMVANMISALYLRMWVTEAIATRFEFYLVLENYHNAREKVHHNPTHEAIKELQETDLALRAYIETSHEVHNLLSRNLCSWYTNWVTNRTLHFPALCFLGIYCYGAYRVIKLVINQARR